jgi:hypothetical protein
LAKRWDLAGSESDAETKSLAFAVGRPEAATGIISSQTGSLSIPPLIEPGTMFDAALLVTGVAFAALRGTTAASSSANPK